MEHEQRDKVIELMERERGRLARDVHDGPAQSLTNTSMRLEVIKRLLESGKVKDAVSEVEKLQGLLRVAVNDVRRMIFDLRPALLQGGLQQAIRAYAERCRQTMGLEINVAGSWPEVDFEHTVEVAMFRIVQELFNNVHKHAGATEVTVTLFHREDAIGFCIRDNGRGFDVSNQRGTSFGFQGMQERVALLNGTLHVSSVIGKGTCVECEVSFPHA